MSITVSVAVMWQAMIEPAEHLWLPGRTGSFIRNLCREELPK